METPTVDDHYDGAAFHIARESNVQQSPFTMFGGVCDIFDLSSDVKGVSADEAEEKLNTFAAEHVARPDQIENRLPVL